MSNSRGIARKAAGIVGLIGVAVAMLAGCQTVRTGAETDPFVEQIRSAYPALKDRSYEVAKVERVVDGDTFVTDDGDRIRLIGADTPESVKPGHPVEHYGKEASRFTKERLQGKKVYLFRDVEDRDRYDRKLRYAFPEDDARMFNETVIREGYANVMTVPPNVLFADLFVKAEREARKAQRGLWADAANGDGR